MLLILLITGTACFSQSTSGRLLMLTDSLTLKTHRTWHREHGAGFTEINNYCSYGMDITFYAENNKVVMHKCVEGTWKEFSYTFKLFTEDDNHYVELYDGNTKLAPTLEIQMLGQSGKFKTELTYYNMSQKEQYNLISNEY